MRTNRGITLLETLMAVAVAGATVTLAAKMAEVAIRQNTRGRQTNDLSSRARSLSDQIRADLQVAGLGSTGAVGVDPTEDTVGGLGMLTPGNRFAIPAVTGADNVGSATGLGRGEMQVLTDAIQIVVPNPSTRLVVANAARAGTNLISVEREPGPIFDNCGMVYVHDHDNPTGGGRTQISFIESTAGSTIQTVGSLMFTVTPGAEVMCARISTYWVDTDGWMRRSDLEPGGVLQIPGSRVFVSAAQANSDVIAGGVLNFQVAYKLSAEYFRAAGTVPGDEQLRWAFGPSPSAESARLFSEPRWWFEVRMVRAHVFAERLRAPGASETVVLEEDRENGDIPPERTRGRGGDWVSVAEPVTNLRMFDRATPVDVPAEPY